MADRRLTIKKIFTNNAVDVEVTVNGWIRSVRKSKVCSFVVLNDGSTPLNLQIVVDNNISNYEQISSLLTGTSISARGVLVRSQGKGQSIEMQAKEVTVLGQVDETYPLQKKGTSLEFLREIAHLRSRTNTFGAVFRIRSTLAQATHQFFKERGFNYLHTPIITASDCEGAGQMFQVTTLNMEKLPQGDKGAIDYSKDYYGKHASLTVSGQLNAECYALGLGAVYTFGPTFRAENSNTPRHLSEFWMIEPEVSFFDLDDVAELAADYIKALITAALTENREDMEFLQQHYKADLIESLQKVQNSEFKKITYTEAIDIFNKAVASGHKFEFPVSWGSDIQTEHERYLAEKHFNGPVIVTDYPKAIKAFYMKQNPDGKTVRAMDVLVPGVGEIIGGSQREDNYENLKARILEIGQNPEDYWWYLDLRKYGSVPHSGFGLGFERAMMYITGMTNVRDVIAFPRTPKNCDF